MKLTLQEIANLVKGELVGNTDVLITGISGIKEALPGDITFLANSKYFPLLKTTKASAVITSKEIDFKLKPCIRTDNPSLAFAKVVTLLSDYKAKHPQGIHPTAIISSKAKLGQNLSIGPYTVIEDDVVIGDNTIIYASCYIGQNTQIGNNCLIYPNVTLREKIKLGNNIIVHSGTVIGSDGFGFANVDEIQEKIPQIGTVILEDNVEIGANVTIDRARFDKTIIGKGTKIDNLVQIAHNVVTGKNCIIVAQAGISGSTELGDKVIIAGQAGLVGHIKIGNNTVIAAQAGVTKSFPANVIVSGYPAKPHAFAKKINAYINLLPEMYLKVKELEKKIQLYLQEKDE